VIRRTDGCDLKEAALDSLIAMTRAVSPATVIPNKARNPYSHRVLYGQRCFDSAGVPLRSTPATLNMTLLGGQEESHYFSEPL
jgi:hypothetical protein